MLVERGVTSVTAVSLLAAPEGIARLEKAFGSESGPAVRVVTAAVDDRLDEHGYIYPAWATPATGCSARSRGRAHPLAPRAAGRPGERRGICD